jgi:NAD(P)-dependent dehydrogenase (short-subunit alcohol dehydrogenase family)
MNNKKTAIVTGAAKGIGKAIAERLSGDGFFIVIVDVDNENGSKLAWNLGNDKASFFNCNIQLENEVSGLFSKIINEHKKVDVLVNNAGIIKDNMIHKMTLDDFESVIDVNLKGTWLMCREAAKIMREQKSGRVINISSRAWLGNAGQSNYSASKAGIVGLTRVLALELGKYNVLVNAIAPGLIDTPLTQALTEEVRNKLIQAQPTKTMGKPEDIANAVSFLANEKTQFITGQTVYIDGGKSIGASF